MAISTRTRFEVLKRDGFTCQYCGRNRDEDNVKLHVDHVISIKEGGSDDLENLVAACQDCNLGKAAKSLDARAPIVDLAEQTRLILEREQKARAYADAKAAEKRLKDAGFNQAWNYWFEVWGVDSLPKSACPWENVLRGYVTKIGVDEVKDGMDIVRNKFSYANNTAVRYLGGILKRKVADFEGRQVLCTYCKRYIVLTPQQASDTDDRETWIHHDCKVQRDAAIAAAALLVEESDVPEPEETTPCKDCGEPAMGYRIICRACEERQFEASFGIDEIDMEVQSWDEIAHKAGF